MSREDEPKKSPHRLWKWAVPDAICQLPQLGLSCFGCCGYDWAPIEQLKKQISMNTWRFTKMYTSKDAFAQTTTGITAVGICKGVIELDDGSIGCPMHPAQNGGKDLRAGDCLQHYECNALRHYKKWPTERRVQYLEFIARGKFDTYTYSLSNSNSSLITAFMESETKSFSERLKGVFAGPSDDK